MVRFMKITKNGNREIVLNKKGQYVVFVYNYSGELKILIEEKGVEVDILGLYIGKKKEGFNLKTIQLHKCPGSSSRSLIRGVFFDKSVFNYKGLIRIEKGADKTSAILKNENIVESDAVRVEAKPFLEILASDVNCTHGVSVGAIPAYELYYLESRGIQSGEAKRLLLVGFVNGVFLQAGELGVADRILRYKKEADNIIASFQK